jgi:hypothetical protein
LKYNEGGVFDKNGTMEDRQVLKFLAVIEGFRNLVDALTVSIYVL